jgi:hypothetical protein
VPGDDGVPPLDGVPPDGVPPLDGVPLDGVPPLDGIDGDEPPGAAATGLEPPATAMSKPPGDAAAAYPPKDDEVVGPPDSPESRPVSVPPQDEHDRLSLLGLSIATRSSARSVDEPDAPGEPALPLPGTAVDGRPWSGDGPMA